MINMVSCLTAIALLLVLGVLFYKFLISNFGYWKKLGIKEGKTYPIAGSFPSQLTGKRNVIYDIDELYRHHKNEEKFVGVYNCRMPQLLILDPTLAHKIYVTDFKHFQDNEFSNFTNDKVDVILANNPFVLKGEIWKQRRAEITPGLTANRINAAYPITLEVCKNFGDYVVKEAKLACKRGINFKPVCLRYTTEVVSDCVLGIKANSFSDNPSPIFEMTQKVFDQSYSFILYSAIVNFVPQIRHVFSVPFFPKVCETFFFNLLQTAIDIRRKAANVDRIDFLNYILHLQEKKNLTAIELTSHTMTFLTDGFETTASVLAHTILLLGKHPEVQTKLRAEIGNKELSFDELTDLPYLDACIYESMRIFSPLLAGRKICTERYDLINNDGTNITLKQGDVVIVPVHCFHNDPDYYEKPEEFIPERFLKESGGVKKYRDMGVFLGFGDGPRVCLGMRFALTQIKAAVIELVRRFDIKLNIKTRRDNYLDDTYFLALLNGGIWLDLEEIK